MENKTNDRFKFKLWDSVSKKWLENFAIRQDGIIDRFLNTENALKNSFTLVQCTGLKDTNGTLIYEGDIVKEGEYGDVYHVIWCYNGYEIKPCFNAGFTLGLVGDEVEIIGNIFENPDLMEGVNNGKI